MKSDSNIILPSSFYQIPTLELAQNLLGCILIKKTEDGNCSGYIVETEAYLGPTDRAAHSFNNRRTKRTEVMFGSSGHAYTYTMHTHCLVNVVSGNKNAPEAILIRALEPLTGIDQMIKRRGTNQIKNLTSGPGKLTKAMGINMDDYGHPLWMEPLYIVKGYEPISISNGKRIGIANSGEAAEYPWRFWITGNPFVSR